MREVDKIFGRTRRSGFEAERLEVFQTQGHGQSAIQFFYRGRPEEADVGEG